MKVVELRAKMSIESCRRRLARVRCIRDCVTSFKDGLSLPEPLCYVPEEVLYGKAGEGKTGTVQVAVYSRPSLRGRGGKVGEIPCGNDTRIGASGAELSNRDGEWIKLRQPALEQFFPGKNVTEGWVLLHPALSSSDETPTLTRIPQEEDKSKSSTYKELFGTSPPTLSRWEDVVEQVYALKLGQVSKVAPCDEEAVDALRSPPTNWTLEYDEELSRFLFENGDHENESLGSVKQYVESLEVSSYRDEDNSDCLTDGDTETYWESDGSQGQHWIRLKMKRSTIVKKLMIGVEASDDNYTPNRIVVMGGELDSMVKLNDISVNDGFSGDLTVLENMTQHYPYIEIRIKDCKDDGIDTRIHGLKIKSSQDRDLGLNRDFFTPDKLVRYPRLETVDPEKLYRRSLALYRFVSLLDSVMHYMVPKWEFSLGSLNCLEEVKQLLPLSKKRMGLIEMCLKESESPRPSSMPKLYINRRTATEHRTDPTKDPECKHAIFTQIYEGLKPRDKYEKPLNYRWPSKYDQWWECKFLSEGIIDQGGGFRDSLSDLAAELCPCSADAPVALPFFVRSPNQVEDTSNVNRDVYVPNPSCTEFAKYEWIGMLMGACLRGKENLVLDLPAFTWKRLVGEKVTWAQDYISVDSSEVKLLESIESISLDKTSFDQNFGVELTWTTVISNGQTVSLKPLGEDTAVGYEERHEYCRLVRETRMAESTEQENAMRLGLLKVVPQAVLDLLTWQELEHRVCGNPEISIEALRKTTYYEDLEQTDPRVKYLWDALSNFTNEDRSRFLRFVTGRRRLPAPLFICPDRGLDTVDALPESSTCSNTLYLPTYSSAKVAEEKIRYAAYNCIAIDTDMSPWEE
ncbi:E3 ubiquitin-protein ligase HECTD3-like isoform X1 [Branchiostoma floridae x Branchiostoma japonicum]